MYNKNRKIYKGISITLVIIWLLIVYFLSAEPSSVSSNTSGKFVNIILKIIYGTSNVNQVRIDIITFIIRKLAHFTLYTLGGILIFNLVMCYNINSNRKKVMCAWFVGTIFAGLDEFHQYFVPGRSAELRDVLIDSLGICVGIILFNLFCAIILKMKGENK